VIGWRRSGKKGEGKLSLGLNLLLNWVSCPVEAQCTFFSRFWNFIPCVTKQGVPVPSFPVFMDDFIVWEKVCYWVYIYLQNLGWGLWLGMQQQKKGRLPMKQRVFKKVWCFCETKWTKLHGCHFKTCNFFPLSLCRIEQNLRMMCLKSSKLLIKVTSKLHGSTNSPMQLLKRIGF
jgi:hypothetical protein